MYDDFYGFTGRPFQLTPDPAFYFESLTHRKALSYLGYGLAQGEGFIVITGEVGAGKSTLVAHLMATLDKARLNATQIVTSKLDGEELVGIVARNFGLPVDGHDKAGALADIERFLHAEARAGRRCLLVVDESQNLSVAALEELRMLSNFQLGAQPLLQVLLLGQPEFRDNLQGHPQLEQLRQRVIAAHHLDPMEVHEIEAYISHRLKLVGWAGNPSFDPALFAQLHTATGGIPRRVNQIVNRLLILGAVEEKSRIDGMMLASVIGELTRDGAMPLGTPVLSAAQSAQSAAIGERRHPGIAGAIGRAPAPVPAPAAPPAGWEAALAGQATQIAELQTAVIELAHGHDTTPADPAQANAVAAIHERLGALESRLIEQDRTIRHTLTMLIEWIERDEAQRAAA